MRLLGEQDRPAAHRTSELRRSNIDRFDLRRSPTIVCIDAQGKTSPKQHTIVHAAHLIDSGRKYLPSGYCHEWEVTIMNAIQIFSIGFSPFLTSVLICFQAMAAEVAAPDFNKEVRPILSAHCLKCHGPDDKGRQAGLRLDVREAAIGVTDSGGRAIVPNNLAASELIRRISTANDSEVMPPLAANKPLSNEQKVILQRWIAAGAQYDQHWAFVPPKQAALPEIKRHDRPRNPIDHFVLSRLDSEGLVPSKPADRYTLVRRVYLDLIGLPPTPEEVDEFVNDASADAYEQLVDRLLKSPHYGERWARQWLDLARYGDTNGYERDNTRSIWPYRDWVIRALNSDMPFDRFTIEQIAGDMLPDATQDQQIATGFHRNTLLNEEGGADPLEHRFYAMVDRVNTTATVWLGLTLGCAQCHTHKYDPILQRDYYQFMAYMNNTEELEIKVSDSEIEARRTELNAKISKLEQGLAERFPLPSAKVNASDQPRDDRTEDVRRHEHLLRQFEKWRSESASHALSWHILRPIRVAANEPILTVLDDGSVLASGDQTKSDWYEIDFSLPLNGITCLRLEALPHEQLPKNGPGRTYYEGVYGDFLLNELTLSSENGTPVLIHRSVNGAAAIDGNIQSRWSSEGRIGQTSVALFQLAQPLKDVQMLRLRLTFENYYPADLGHFRVSATIASAPSEVSPYPAEIESLLCKPIESLSPPEYETLLKYYLSTTPELADVQREINELRSKMPALPTTLIFAERPSQYSRNTCVHNRGEYLQPTDPVKPAMLSAFHTLTAKKPSDRLGLARWLIGPGNPLVGRVTVNRQWAAFFGRGLVETLDDFGYQGQPPTHPELLDWLAVEFARRNWSMKEIHRLIVTSATYQQASQFTPELRIRDPENKLLARGPRHRLEAEQIRDAALRASGLLSFKIGGPSVFPIQPPGATEGPYAPVDWKVSKGEDRYRRGLYTFCKRTMPFAMADVFDAPNGSVCVAKRQISSSPLQSLVILNDPLFVEASQALGKRMANETGTIEQKCLQLFRRVLSRSPTADEQRLTQDFYHAQENRLNSRTIDASKISGGSTENSKHTLECAAWTIVARGLLNSYEAICKE